MQVNQESLNSFLNVAHKLKIKGLCERPLIQPEPPLHQAVAITLPIKDEKKVGLGGHGGLESLLGRSAGQYMADSGQQVGGLSQQNLTPMRHSLNTAPPAHQCY